MVSRIGMSTRWPTRWKLIPHSPVHTQNVWPLGSRVLTKPAPLTAVWPQVSCVRAPVLLQTFRVHCTISVLDQAAKYKVVNLANTLSSLALRSSHLRSIVKPCYSLDSHRFACMKTLCADACKHRLMPIIHFLVHCCRFSNSM